MMNGIFRNRDRGVFGAAVFKSDQNALAMNGNGRMVVFSKSGDVYDSRRALVDYQQVNPFGTVLVLGENAVDSALIRQGADMLVISSREELSIFSFAIHDE